MSKLHSSADEMRRIVKSDMHQLFSRFHRNYLEPASKSIEDVLDEAEIERQLEESYGGTLQFHTKTHEQFGLDLSQYVYQPIAAIIEECRARQNQDDQAQDVTDSNEALQDINQLGDESIRCLLAELEGVSQEHAVIEQPLDATLQLVTVDESAAENQVVYVVEEQAVYLAEEEAAVDAPEGNTSVAEKGMARHCSPDCIFPTSWAIRLHLAFSTMDPTGTADELCTAMAQFEDCDKCQPNLRCAFNDLDTCTNGLRLMMALMVHFQHMRTVIRRYYEIRQSFLWLRDMKDALENSDLKRLLDLIKHPNLNTSLRGRIEESISRDEESVHSQAALLSNPHFEVIIDNFNKGIRDFRLIPCEVCERLYRQSEVCAL